ncbi:MAG TPA: hypothetical protein VKA21_13675 [Candidatus Binatia bacterium]|nr:hypothetical protein [Candidatus Binatia bacterium]
MSRPAHALLMGPLYRAPRAERTPRKVRSLQVWEAERASLQVWEAERASLQVWEAERASLQVWEAERASLQVWEAEIWTPA